MAEGYEAPDVRERLARLNASTVRFNVGRGGMPTETPQDIAAALGMVPPGLGREVLIACWWPDGAMRDPKALANAVLAVVEPEWSRQGVELEDARMQLSMAEVRARWHGSALQEYERDLLRAKLRWKQVRARCWPKDLPAMLPVLTYAAIDEISKRNLCPCCEGRRQVMDGKLKKDCGTCRGTGVVPLSDRTRAERIGKAESRYRATWRPCYEFLLGTMREAEYGAAVALRRALKGGRS